MAYPVRVPTTLVCSRGLSNWLGVSTGLLMLVFQVGISAQERCELAIQVQDSAGQMLACRIHLKDPAGQPVRPTTVPFWHDHFVCDGAIQLELTAGEYAWEIEKGPEYERRRGKLELRPGKKTLKVKLPRIADLRQQNWYSADLHVHRPPADMKLLMRAEDLAFAPVTTWWNRPADKPQAIPQPLIRFDQFRIYTRTAGEDEREGGALLFFGLDRPLDLTVQSREVPSPMFFVRQARQFNPDVWIDIEKPFWWDVPVWLASGKMQSIGIANNHLCRGEMLDNEAWGKPRDIERWPGPHGNGLWSQEIYYHMLNSGLRLSPSAGSASGVLPNPVGYNRVYVHCPGEFTRDRWFAALKRGRAWVTNGPLLLVQANESLPGEEFPADSLKRVFRFRAELISSDHVPHLEVIHNGRVIKQVPCERQLRQELSWEIPLDAPGWLLVRAISDHPRTFRFASTAPWYIAAPDGQPVISRKSAQFFLDWTRERIERVKSNVKDLGQLTEVLRHHDQALDFWIRQTDQATRE